VHWTQKPENRERVIAMVKRTAAKRKRNKKYTKHDAASRKRISAAMKAVYAKKRAAVAAANGHVAAAGPEPIAWKRARAKASLAALAVIGARVRLAELDREREMLLMLIEKSDEKP